MASYCVPKFVIHKGFNAVHKTNICKVKQIKQYKLYDMIFDFIPKKMDKTKNIHLNFRASVPKEQSKPKERTNLSPEILQLRNTMTKTPTEIFLTHPYVDENKQK